MEGKVFELKNYKYSTDDKVNDSHYAEIYNGTNTKLKTSVRIKVIRKATLQKNSDLINLIFLEIETLRELKDCEFMIKYIENIEFKEDHYIILGNCNEGSLKDKIMSRKYLPEAEAVKILSDILRGYLELKKKNIIHRNINPRSFLFDDGKIVFGDLGFLSKSTGPCEQYGVKGYIAPEVYESKPYNNKIDIWSIGVLFYEMLFGTRPFKTESEYSKRLEFPSDKPISETSKKILSGMLHINPAKRISFRDIYTTYNLSNIYTSENYFPREDEKLESFVVHVKYFYIHRKNVINLCRSTLKEMHNNPTKKLRFIMPNFLLSKKIWIEQTKLLQILNSKDTCIPGLSEAEQKGLSDVYKKEDFILLRKDFDMEKQKDAENFNSSKKFTKFIIEELVKSEEKNKKVMNQNYIALLNDEEDDSFLTHYHYHLTSLAKTYKEEALSQGDNKDKLELAYMLLLCVRLDNNFEYENSQTCIAEIQSYIQNIKNTPLDELKLKVKKLMP